MSWWHFWYARNVFQVGHFVFVFSCENMEYRKNGKSQKAPIIWIKWMQPKGSSLMFAAILFSAVVFIIFLPALHLLTCNNFQIDGVYNQLGQQIDPPSIKNECNSNCSCSRNIYHPVWLVSDISTLTMYDSNPHKALLKPIFAIKRPE